MKSSLSSSQMQREESGRMADLYCDLAEIAGTLEAYVPELETIILNGGNEKANYYLRGAIEGIQGALSAISDAEFEIDTSPVSYDDSEDEIEE